MTRTATESDQAFPRALKTYFIIYLVLLVVISFFLRERYATHFDFKDRIRYRAEGDFPFSYLYVGDAWNYHKLALGLTRGEGYGFPYYPPAFPYTLYFLYKITAPDKYLESPAARADIYDFKCYVPSKRIISIINAAGLFIAGLLFFYLYGPVVAVIGVFLCAFSFGLFIMSGSFNSESIFIPLYLLTLAFYLFAYRKQSLYTAVPAGLLSGFLVLCRAEAVGVVILSLLYFAIGWKNGSLKRWIFLIIFIPCFLIFPALWGLKNYREFHEFTLISKNGPVNFYIGNNPLATGGYSEKIFKSGHGIRELDPRNPEHYKALAKGYKIGFAYWIDNPARAVNTVKLKFFRFVYALRNGFLLTNFPSGLNGFRDLGDSFYSRAPFMVYIFGPLVIAGLILGLFFRSPGFLFPYIFLTNTVVVNLLYFGLTRSGTTMLPLLYLFSALTISWILFFLRSKTRLVIFLFGVLAICLFLYGMWESRSKVMLDTMDELFREPENLMKTGKIQEAIRAYDDAFEKSSTLPHMINDHYGIAVAHLNMGSLCIQAKNPSKAEQHYLLALNHDPTNMQATLNLAHIYKDFLAKPETALRFFEQFLELNPPEGDAQNAKTEILKLKIDLKEKSGI